MSQKGSSKQGVARQPSEATAAGVHFSPLLTLAALAGKNLAPPRPELVSVLFSQLFAAGASATGAPPGGGRQTTAICQKLGAVGLTALGRAQLCPAVAGGALLRLSLPGPRCSLRAICPCGARLVNVSTVGAAPRSTQAFTAR
jgi:hypothetical protein